MSTKEPVGTQPQARAVDASLTRGLVDDAAIFPPGNAPLSEAVTQHERHLSGWYAAALGPLLVRLGDTAALHDLLAGGRRLAVGLVCPPTAAPDEVATAVTRVHRDDRAVVTALEQPVADRAAAERLGSAAAALGARAWAEVPSASTLDGTLDQRLDDIAAAGAYAKYRTGGVQPDAFPDEQQLARFLAACVRRELPFKLTAGLHHAVRHTAVGAAADGKDLEQHGVLNVVSALAAALAGSGHDDLAGLLADRDPMAVTSRVAALDDETLGRVRAVFRSFGCCGVTDPLTDLVTLGLLDRPTPDDSDTKETS